jgi:2-polyprenyl-3-methyl-5-hydroxy-6-metoxy-1,4-benzoquinol methylase
MTCSNGSDDAVETPLAETGRPSVRTVEQAYERALQLGNASVGQLHWRRSRFVRGLSLIEELQHNGVGLKNARVVDLGAAHGGDCCALLTAGARPTAVDFRNHGYDVLKRELRRVNANLNVVLANSAVPLPFQAESFDVVLAINLIEHLPNRAAFFAELWRILAPGGVVFLTTPAAWKSIGADPFYGSAVTGILPMPVRRIVAEKLLRRRYPFPLFGKTCYSSRSILVPATQAGFEATACKYQDSPLGRSARRWPVSRLWMALIHRFAFDFVILRKPPRAHGRSRLLRTSC